MNEFYAEIRLVHIYAVLTSGALLFVRGGLALTDERWPLSFPFRLLDYTLHTVILTVAMMLMVIIQQYPFVHAWLTVKLVFYILYAGLYFLALQPAIMPFKKRALYWLSGLAVFGFIYTVGRAHHPLGFLADMAG